MNKKFLSEGNIIEYEERLGIIHRIKRSAAIVIMLDTNETYFLKYSQFKLSQTQDLELGINLGKAYQ